MIKKIKSLFKVQFVRNVSTMLSGTTMAQAIVILSSPLLTRLFTPADFGYLAVVTSISAIMAIIYTLQYDMVIVLVKDNTAAKQFMGISLNITVLIFILALILGSISFYFPLLEIVGYENIPPYILIVSLFAGLLIAVKNILSQWTTRSKAFKFISSSLVIATAISTIFNLVMGYFYGNFIVLILGSLLLYLVNIASLLRRGNNLKSFQEGVTLSTHWDSSKRLLRDYKDFPKYRLPQSLLNTIGQNIPTLVMISFFSPTIAGFYALAYRMVKVPGMLVSNSIRSVFFQKAAELYNKKTGLYQALFKVTLWLALGGLIPFLTIAIISPPLFSFVFGSEWEVAGTYASILAIWMYTVFCNTPATAVMPVLRLQKRYLVFNIISLAARTGALIFGGMTGGAFEAILYYVISGSLYNILIIVDVHWQVYRYEKYEVER